MGWKNKLKKYAPAALKILTGDVGGGASDVVSNVVEAMQSNPIEHSPDKASVDQVRVVATAVDDHQEDIKALKAELAELKKRLPAKKS